MEIFFCGYLNKIIMADKMTIEYLDNQTAKDIKRLICQQKNMDCNELNDIWVVQLGRLLYDDDVINSDCDIYLLPPILGG